MLQNFKYPVNNLNANISKNIADLVRYLYPELSKDKNFNPKVDFFDEGSKISDVAEVRKVDLDGTCVVKLSIAYCQFLWLLCDASLKAIDHSIIEKSCELYGISLDTFKKCTEFSLSIPREQLAIMLQSSLQSSVISIEGFLSYNESILQILEPDFFKKNNDEINLAFSLVDGIGNLNLSEFDKYSKYGPYDVKSNSAYCYGITFILLHELAHYQKGHLQKQEEDQEDEEIADQTAFWDMYCTLSDELKFSANVGILCALFSLLFLNPSMAKEDGDVHPREDKRIFDVYNSIKSDNPKYTLLLVRFFNAWAKGFSIKDYPSIATEDDNAVRQILQFLSSKEVFD